MSNPTVALTREAPETGCRAPGPDALLRQTGVWTARRLSVNRGGQLADCEADEEVLTGVVVPQR